MHFGTMCTKQHHAVTGVLYDMRRVYEGLSQLSDMRKAREKLSRLETVLMIIVIAKVRGNGKRYFAAHISKAFSLLSDAVRSVAFSPDGKYVASGSEDNTARVWDVSTGEEIARMTHDGTVWPVAFSPAGKYVLSVGDVTARVWRYHPQDLVEESCSRVTRNLTIEEWRQYVGDIFPYQAICTNVPLPEASLQEIASEALDQTENSLRVQTATKIILDLLSQNESVDNAEDEARRFIISVVTLRLDALSSTYIYSDENLRQVIARFDDAKSLDLDFGEFIDSLDNVCWQGSISGYAKDVLEYCEQAVQLAPEDVGIRDSRGLARALTGDFTGAIDDFQFYVNHAGSDSSVIQMHKQWIMDLEAGKNPFTLEVLEQLSTW